ncbi:TVP38/TMEM64 family protein [Roseibium sp. CAU 1637]|uniref:TVP38/TMEM64 family membrane protein n=1 Tax=Roseibium limicola TaxID=2816037 RepID=A0A939ENC0_9HYPH|nr:VTT domain-containing protein [Roseibium limicola]MBO0345719.1 TVP38/TMEM64 family protein [Roseibium limicola]
MGDKQIAGENRTSSGVSWGRWGALAALLMGLAVAYAYGLQDYLTLSALIREHQALSEFVEAHLIAALALYILIYIAAVALSFPGASFLTIAGGYLFGWMVSGTAAVLAATAGATLVFLIARSSVGEVFRRKAGGWLARMREGFQNDAFSYMLFLRLTPIFPFWLVNMAPALLGVRLSVYSVATLLGIIPGTFAFSIVGSGLGSLIDAQEQASPGCGEAGTCNVEISALITPTMLVALFALGILALIPVVLKSRRKG